MCRALGVTCQGYCAWASRQTSVHDARDAELAALISQARGNARNIYGAMKTFMRLRALGVCTSRKRVARIMCDNGWRGVMRACAKRASGEKRACARLRRGPRGARFLGSGAKPGVLRRHLLREDEPGVADHEWVSLAFICFYAPAASIQRAPLSDDRTDCKQALFRRSKTKSPVTIFSFISFAHPS